MFLRAATGNPYIVSISTSGMFRSSNKYIYIIRDPMRNCNNEFILLFILREKKMADFERGQLEIGLEFVH